MEKIYKQDIEIIINKYDNIELIDASQWTKNGHYLVVVEREYQYIQKTVKQLRWLSFDSLEEFDLQLKRVSSNRMGRGKGYSEDFINLIITEREKGLPYDKIMQKHSISKETLVYICTTYGINKLKKERKKKQ